MTGEAQQVRVEKRNVVHTTTRHVSHPTSNFDYMSGRIINGSVSVPVNDIHTETEIESEFWLTDKNGKEKHFSFDHEIVPMKNGQRISVIWGALTGTERGKYKCIYNHATGAFKMLPNSFGDLGVVRPSRNGVDITMGAAIVLLLLVLFGILIGLKDGFSWVFYCSIPSLLMYLWHLSLRRSLVKDYAVVNDKVKAITKIIIEYASNL
jgi:hypothetical protein